MTLFTEWLSNYFLIMWQCNRRIAWYHDTLQRAFCWHIDACMTEMQIACDPSVISWHTFSARERECFLLFCWHGTFMRVWQKCKLRATLKITIAWYRDNGKVSFCWHIDACATEMQIACDSKDKKNYRKRILVWNFTTTKTILSTNGRHLSCVPFDFLLTIRNGT